MSVNGAGDAVITWSETPQRCANRLPCTSTFMAAFRRRGEQTWTTPVVLGDSASGSVRGQVAIDGNGDATAVFLDYPPDFVTGAPPSVRVVSSHAGRWDPAITLATGPGFITVGVAVNDAGDAAV